MCQYGQVGEEIVLVAHVAALPEDLGGQHFMPEVPRRPYSSKHRLESDRGFSKVVEYSCLVDADRDFAHITRSSVSASSTSFVCCLNPTGGVLLASSTAVVPQKE